MPPNESEIKRIVAESVKETLLTLGLDVTDPMQIQADFRHLRVWRQSVDTVRKQGLITAVGVLLTGVFGALYFAFQTKWHP